jgi:hypothetical protein
MKTRSSSGVGQKVDLDFNVETLRITDLGEEESQGSYTQSGGNKPSSIYANLKKTSTVNNAIDHETGEIADPTQGINIGKIRGTADSAKIRTMLASLNSEKD